MRTFAIATTFAALVLAGTASAQVSVPNTFAAGTPARAAEVNANFQALVTAMNSLSTRVSKLEGNIVSSDLVGTYTVNQFQTELGASSSTSAGRVAVYTGGGTVTFAVDGRPTPGMVGRAYRSYAQYTSLSGFGCPWRTPGS